MRPWDGSFEDMLLTVDGHHHRHVSEFEMKIDMKRTHAIEKDAYTSSEGSMSPTPSTPTSTMAALSSEETCGYRTGKCTNLPAVKRNGKLHKLCAFHREKANQNQKKLDRKKRMQRFSPYVRDACPASPAPVVRIKPEAKTTPRALESASEFVSLAPTSLQEAPLSLGHEELAIFYNLMTFDINQHQRHYRQAATPVVSHAPYEHFRMHAV